MSLCLYIIQWYPRTIKRKQQNKTQICLFCVQTSTVSCNSCSMPRQDGLPQAWVFVEGGSSALPFMVQLPPHVGAGVFSTLDMKRHREARAEMLFGLDPWTKWLQTIDTDEMFFCMCKDTVQTVVEPFGLGELLWQLTCGLTTSVKKWCLISAKQEP